MLREIPRALPALVGAWLALLGSAGCSLSLDAGGASGAGGSGGGTGGQGGEGGEGMRAPLVAKAIAVGRAHGCALLEDSGVACWGAGDMGQLGDGASGGDHVRTSAARIPKLSGVTQIRAGGDTTCAIVGAGGVSCWGDGRFGQLGNGSSGDGSVASTPVVVTGISDAVDLDVAGPNVCAVLAGGSVRCWGLNDPSEWLGFASPDCGPFLMPMGMPVVLPCETAPKAVPGLGGAVRVASGGSHNCALVSGGGVSCWGTDSFGQLGDGMSGKDHHNPVPTPIQGASGVTAVVAGSAHTCAIGADKAVQCWGDNSFGQLGIGTDALDSYKTKPTLVPALAGVVDLYAAGHAACAARSDGSVACWGETRELFESPADPMKGTTLEPTKVPGIGGVVQVQTEGFHACALTHGGAVICWGVNDRGESGNGSIAADDYSLSPVSF